MILWVLYVNIFSNLFLIYLLFPYLMKPYPTDIDNIFCGFNFKASNYTLNFQQIYVDIDRADSSSCSYGNEIKLETWGLSLTSSIISPISMKHEVICKWHAALSFPVKVTGGVSRFLSFFTQSNLTLVSGDLYSSATWSAFESLSLFKVKTTVLSKNKKDNKKPEFLSKAWSPLCRNY